MNKSIPDTADLVARLRVEFESLLPSEGDAGFPRAILQIFDQATEALRTPTPGDPAGLEWAVSKWRSEVENRPLQNVHRRSLDTTWRQVIRYFGGEDESLCGPRHDDLALRRPAPASDAAAGEDAVERAIKRELSFYIEDAQDGICRVPRETLVKARAVIAATRLAGQGDPVADIETLARQLYNYVGAVGVHGPDPMEWEGRTEAHKDLWRNAVRAIVRLTHPAPEGAMDIRAAALEEAARVADSFACGVCGMDGKAGAAIRALGTQTEGGR